MIASGEKLGARITYRVATISWPATKRLDGRRCRRIDIAMRLHRQVNDHPGKQLELKRVRIQLYREHLL